MIDGPNLYMYVKLNPILNYDVLGRQTGVLECYWMYVIVAIVGGVAIYAWKQVCEIKMPSPLPRYPDVERPNCRVLYRLCRCAGGSRLVVCCI